MNMKQVEYFFSVAECLSFSEAAKRLYMTQPALGRQIRALEEELGLTLFVRGKRALQLTPGGKVLYAELGEWIRDYNGILEKARLANSAIENKLDIGILEGHQLGSLFTVIYDYYRNQNPQIQVTTHRSSFSPLIEQLYQGDVDIIITLDFDVAGRHDIEYRVIAEMKNYLVVPCTHKLAGEKNLSLIQFKDDLFIVNSPEDTRAGYNNLMNECLKAGFTPNYKTASTLDEYMLWLEVGYGISVLSEMNHLRLSPYLKFLSLPEISGTALAIAWHVDNVKPATQAFIDAVELLTAKKSPKAAKA